MQRLTRALCAALLVHLGFAAARLAPEDKLSPLYNPEIEKWRMQDVTFKSPKNFGNPFREGQLSATFRCSERPEAYKIDGWSENSRFSEQIRPFSR
jgi:hypothetical protein